MIISLDCSTTAIGWAVFDKDNLIEYGRLTPSISGLECRERVYNLLPQLEKLLKNCNTYFYFLDLGTPGWLQI